MLGALSAGKKAATYGYKKYGVPGAVVASTGGAVGVVVAKKGAKAIVESKAKDATDDEESDDSETGSSSETYDDSADLE
ncbi:hypothetical protein OB955_07485 [Halobacteria archaeon AArc-m2/3/4]|uniref:Uncharacterized protein n=1 Tax=Natronoglomus mannanivorans TaxID=2979990 RepID=A0ABT2QCC7_9EURY|nr:hypothetical protein [Halobacteria archaeon AArc-m2/3/4]